MAVDLTDYSETLARGIEGQIADSGPKRVDSLVNEEASAVPYGRGVKRGTANDQFLLPAAAADEVVGVLVHTHVSEDLTDDGIATKEPGNVMRVGRLFVKPEQAVSPSDKVFVRHTAGGAGETKGRLRKDNDGVAQVTTVTPTAANSTLYTLNVFVDGKLFSFQVTSDASATATEICDAFRTAMAADSAFTALVTGSGTATLILTGVNTGKAFQVTDGGSPGDLAVAETTPASTKATELVGAKWRSTTTAADEIAELELNLPQ